MAPDPQDQLNISAQAKKPRLLVISRELAGAPLSESTIRTWHLATHLPAVDVTLAFPAEVAEAPPARAFRPLPYGRDGAELRSALALHDAVLIQPLALLDFPFLADAGLPLVVDLAVSCLPERLEAEPPILSDDQRGVFLEELRILNESLRAGDFFLCGSETERDFWRGMLFANHRVNPHTLAHGSDLRHLLDVVADASTRVGTPLGPLAAFCAHPRRAPDHGRYVTDLERVAKDRAEAIEGLLEFNYWHRSSVDRGHAIEYLEGQLRALQAELEHYRQVVKIPQPS